ncbi:retron St85 family RNA-directed DNA polymerase [Pseudoxanthomonas sp. PXM04]|uniref:retron St85 family RNA-directed DNA polymerase n=1 Tax=Pseudoxanthomonas sp. PXM04 TaxID=2769297 RepID=UPI001780D05E|nr:retron St85 family RNA-directed DNA polymerase [Pseudoxanthomonas sp. PXM04]MBD9378325.1 RNA-directed DNA polymerase [Pseudoxanthomonas sp. PXM04]
MTLGLISAIASEAGISKGSALRVAVSAYKRYKVFKIKKRSGDGTRTVAQPAREVKAIQRAIVQFLSSRLPVHDAATAYVGGSSIYANANFHAGARYLLKMDFSNFFPSIRPLDIERHLLRHLGSEISPAEVSFVIQACIWRDPEMGGFGLCIGAPSSPFISNTILHEFDTSVRSVCDEYLAKYTRYSDDMTFSADGPDVLAEVERRVRAVVKEMRSPVLLLNENKRVAVSRSAAFRVTGLTLPNQGGVSVGRKRKRGVRAGVHKFVLGQLDAKGVEKLKGELAFVLSIEPEFRYVLVETYGGAIHQLLPGKWH